MAKTVDLKFFPGFTRKSVSFTIDDGHIAMDKKLIERTKPYGILGTFNLCSDRMKQSPDFYRDFYAGYEIANHCKHHPYCMSDGKEYTLTDKPFDRENADTSLSYPACDEGVYYVYHANRPAWIYTCTPEGYIKCINDNNRELEEIFGKGTVKSFVWPYGEQDSEAVKKALRNMGFYGARKTGTTGDSESFNLPGERFSWMCTTYHKGLLETAKKYDEYGDDGELKFFCFGVHSVDFETAKNWDELLEFSKLIGNRPDEYYYASVGDIFAYEDAVKSAEVSESDIKNNSPLTLYATVDGERMTVAPYATMKI